MDYADFKDSHGKNLLLNPRQSAQSVKSAHLRNGLLPCAPALYGKVRFASQRKVNFAALRKGSY